MSKSPKLTNFVSDMDLFLLEFAKQNPTLSTSQLKEVIKYRRIYELRDSPERERVKNVPWDKF